MNRLLRLIVISIIPATAAVVQADILHMRDGSRYYGQIIRQDDRTIVFRVVLSNGRSDAVQTFSMERVERVQRTGRRDVPPGESPIEREEPEDTKDHEQMLREGFELLNDGNRPAALRAIQRAVQGASEPVLSVMEARCLRTRGVPLDELLACIRVRVAAGAGGGRGFKLRAATRYERPALGRLLCHHSNILLSRVYSDRTLADWADHVDEYGELKSDSRRLVVSATRTAALIAVRLKYDPALKGSREERIHLSGLRKHLMRLSARIIAQPGYLDLSDAGWDDPVDSCSLSATTQPVNAGTTEEESKGVE